MSNEIQLSCQLIVSGGNAGAFRYTNPTQSFTISATAAIANGEGPGAVQYNATPGTQITFTHITNPGGLAWIQNLDPTCTMYLGIWDPDTNVWYPIYDFLPGEGYPCRLSSLLGDSFGVGTGVSATNKKLMLRGTGTGYGLVSAMNK